MIKSKILIIGCQGQIGKTLCEELAKVNANFIGLNKAHLDITDTDQVVKVLGTIDFDVLINCAAFTNTEDAEAFPEKAFLVNEKGVANLAKACAMHDKALVHISTNCVFDGVKTTPYTETDLPNPRSVYGKSKYAGEQAALKNNAKTIVLRTSWAFSQYPGHNFVLKILKIGKDQGFLKVVNDQFGCPTAAKSIARLIIDIVPKLVKENAEYGIYHFGSDTPTSWFGFTEKIFTIAQKLGLASPIEIEAVKTGVVSTKVDRPKNGVLDCNKIQQIFKVGLPSWEQELQNTIQTLSTKWN